MSEASVTRAMQPDEQIQTIKANLILALRGQIAALKLNNPGEITRILLLEPGPRQEAIKGLLTVQIATQISPVGVKLTYRVKSDAPVQALKDGAVILEEEWPAIIQGVINSLTVAGVFGAGPGNCLYRNTSEGVTPAIVIANGSFRHKDPCSPANDVIAHIFSGNAGTILFSYTRDPKTLPFTVVSATTDGDNTQGQSPTWSYAFPRPGLTQVPSGTIAAYLGGLAATGGGTVLAKVTATFPRPTAAESVDACLGGLFTLQTDTGALPGAITAFVSTQGSAEHILLNTMPFTAGQDYFRRIQPDERYTYRDRWKLLSHYNAYTGVINPLHLPL
ncbi:MAG TPA: hypothetical protein VGI74_02490 [Streptosporangiaceae bacterium]|jgi:hypothetical protein